MANSKYSHDYIEQTFYLWYESDKPGGRKLATIIMGKEGKSPSVQLLEEWRKEYGWDERGDALDAKLSVALDTQVIDKRILMFEKHAEVGEMIIAKGREYFETHDVDDANSAIRAITAGVEIQRLSVGQAEAWAKVAKMSDAQIVAELRKLTGKAPAENEFPIEADTEVIDLGNGYGEIIESDTVSESEDIE